MDAALTITTGYQALRSSAAWLDLSPRGKIRVLGEDRARLLHALTTQDVQSLAPGQGCYAFFLNAQGRILGDVNIFCREDFFLLDTDPETRQKLFDHIDRYIIADDVTLADITSEMATVSIEGPHAAEVLARLGFPEPELEFGTLPWAGSMVARVTATGAGGFSIFLPASEKASLITVLEGLAIPQASAQDARTVRIEHGRPRYGEEITERYLVQETAQLQAVHFSKGCYLGQEIVERVRSRAQIHRVLRRCEIDLPERPDENSPEPGWPVAGTKLKAAKEAADAGEIASAAFSPALSKVAALAYIRTQFAEPGTELRLAGPEGSGNVRVLVL